MKILLKDIPEEGLWVKGVLTADAYGLPLADYQDWKTIEYKLFVQILGTECLVMGELSTAFKAPCARCLESLPMPIHVPEFRHSYAVVGLESIDLTQEIREDILLALPLAPRCQLDAKFRCPITGQLHREPVDQFAELRRQSVWGILDRLKKKE